MNVTSDPGFLDLDQAVLSARPNPTVVSSAVYGAPKAVATNSGPGCSWFGCI